MVSLTTGFKRLFGVSFVATTVIVAAALAFTSCGGDDDGDPTPSAATRTVTLGTEFDEGDVVCWEAPSMANYSDKYFVAKKASGAEDAPIVVDAPKGDYYALTKASLGSAPAGAAATVSGFYKGAVTAHASGAGIYAVQTVASNGTLGAAKYAKVEASSPITTSAGLYKITGYAIEGSNTNVTNSADGWFVTSAGTVAADSTGGIYKVETVQANGTLGAPKYVKAVSSGNIVESGTGLYYISGEAIQTHSSGVLTDAEATADTSNGWFVLDANALAIADSTGNGIYAVETVNAQGVLGAPKYVHAYDSEAKTLVAAGNADTIVKVTGYTIATDAADESTNEAWYTTAISTASSNSAGIYSVETVTNGTLGASVYKNIPVSTAVTSAAGIYRITYWGEAVNSGGGCYVEAKAGALAAGKLWLVAANIEVYNFSFKAIATSAAPGNVAAPPNGKVSYVMEIGTYVTSAEANAIIAGDGLTAESDTYYSF